MTTLLRTLSLLLVLVSIGCASAPALSPTAPAAAPDSQGTAAPPNPAGLAGSVNGESIPLAAFERELNRQRPLLGAASEQALRSEVLEQMIEQTLLRQGARALNISISDADLQAEIDAQIAEVGGAEAWASWLATNGYTPEEFPEILRDVLLANGVRDSLTADLAGNVRQANARHILVRTEREAQDVMARLGQGEDFAALATALSQDETTRDDGGSLGWFVQDELLLPALAQTVFALQSGQIAGPVPTERGYHIVQVVEFAERPVEPERWVFIAQMRFENWLRPLVVNANIERFVSQ